MKVEVNSPTALSDGCLPIPVSIPTNTQEYKVLRRLKQATLEPGGALPIPVPVPLTLPGARVLMWKQDPTVAEIGIRKAYLPGRIFTGPKDARVSVSGLPAVIPNVNGDLVQTPGTEAFDAVHTFAVVRQTLTLHQRLLGSVVPWQWNSPTNTDPIAVFPRAGSGMNAFYSRDAKSLNFLFFSKPGAPVGSPLTYTCRSFDIVAHETGHAVLDGLKPNWLSAGNPPQTGGLHESFGDLSAIFLALSQLDQVEAIIAQTKGNLHDKSFLSDLAEEFGIALGRTNGLRNADNDLKLSEAGTEVHAISQVFTGGIYDVLADIFTFERRPSSKDDAAVLYDVSSYLHGLLLRAIIAAPDTAATYASVVNKMLTISSADGKPVEYRNFIRNRFTVREVVVSPTAFSADFVDGLQLEANVQDAAGAVQNRCRCCGTMQSSEYAYSDTFADQILEFQQALTLAHSNGALT